MTGHQSTKIFTKQKLMILAYASENSFEATCKSDRITIIGKNKKVEIMPKKKMYTVNGITKEYSNAIARLNIIFDTIKQHEPT